MDYWRLVFVLVSPSSFPLVTEGNGGMILGVSLVNPTNGSAALNGSVELKRNKTYDTHEKSKRVHGRIDGDLE